MHSKIKLPAYTSHHDVKDHKKKVAGNASDSLPSNSNSRFLFGCYILGYRFSTKLRHFATFKTPEVDHLPCGMTEPSGETGVGFKRLWIGMISNRLPKLR